MSDDWRVGDAASLCMLCPVFLLPCRFTAAQWSWLCQSSCAMLDVAETMALDERAGAGPRRLRRHEHQVCLELVFDGLH